MSLSALLVSVVAIVLSFLSPWLYHKDDQPDVHTDIAGSGVVWVRYMGTCDTGEKLLTAILEDGQPTCPKGELEDDNYIVSISVTFHNKGSLGGEISDLSLVMQTPDQEYVFEPFQLERKGLQGLEVDGHLPDPLVVGPGSAEYMILGFRSQLGKGRLVFSERDAGTATLHFRALVDGVETHQIYTFDFVGYVKTTGFVAWREK